MSSRSRWGTTTSRPRSMRRPPGPVGEGCVGAGTGMQCFDFKGGIGTASRVVDASAGGYTVGVVVLTNYGDRESLRIDGVPWAARSAT